LIIERFRTDIARDVFRLKYAQGPNDTWDALADRLVDDVCGTRGGTLPALMSANDRKELAEHIKCMRFLPGGRYLYYAGGLTKRTIIVTYYEPKKTPEKNGAM
jgi:ribonucleoside-diphosphate reductase alpha chain